MKVVNCMRSLDSGVTLTHTHRVLQPKPSKSNQNDQISDDLLVYVVILPFRVCRPRGPLGWIPGPGGGPGRLPRPGASPGTSAEAPSGRSGRPLCRAPSRAPAKRLERLLGGPGGTPAFTRTCHKKTGFLRNKRPKGKGPQKEGGGDPRICPCYF